jgi:hypothetical protein
VAALGAGKGIVPVIEQAAMVIRPLPISPGITAERLERVADVVGNVLVAGSD